MPVARGWSFVSPGVPPHDADWNGRHQIRDENGVERVMLWRAQSQLWESESGEKCTPDVAGTKWEYLGLAVETPDPATFQNSTPSNLKPPMLRRT